MAGLRVHPGGPFWAKKDDRGWSIPKGEFEPGEQPLAAARREFEEEMGRVPPPPGPAPYTGGAEAARREGDQRVVR